MHVAPRAFSVALIIPRISTTAIKCFLPDGSSDNNDLPYFADDTLSRCCAPDEFCSTNKLCVSINSIGNKFARGSCLDAAFGGTCPNFCKGIKDSGKVDLYQCGDISLGQFCCDEGKGLGSACCSASSNIITLGIGTTFSEATSASIMAAMSNVPLLIQPRSVTTRGFVTSVVSQASVANRPSASTIPNSSIGLLSTASLVSLVTSLLKPSSILSQVPTTLPGDFTNLPSPVFTSIFVPTSTLPPQRTSGIKTSTTTPSISPLTTPPIVIPSSILFSSSATNQTLTSNTTALSATASASASASLIPAARRLNSQAIIAGTVGGAVAVFLITFFVILYRQQQKRRKSSVKAPLGAPDASNTLADEKGSIRSVHTNSSNQTAFGYKPQPKRNASDRSDDNGNNISVPIVFRSETPIASIKSADIRSIEEQIQRMSGTTFRSAGMISAETRRMTPGSDFNVYQSPMVTSPTTARERSRSRDALEGANREYGAEREERARDSHYVDERELETYGFTPEDLNRVGGTGYGQGPGSIVVPMNLDGMEGRIPNRLSGLSERSATYQKLLYDVKSQPF